MSKISNKILIPLFQEKPKEKTMFTLRLESFDAAAKAKVIREVKATFANMNLMEVSNPSLYRTGFTDHHLLIGEEIRRVRTTNSQGKRTKRGGRKAKSCFRGARSQSHRRVIKLGRSSNQFVYISISHHRAIRGFYARVYRSNAGQNELSTSGGSI